eukprot:9028293-Pyramimonas_sp.AAC.1
MFDRNFIRRFFGARKYSGGELSSPVVGWLNKGLMMAAWGPTGAGGRVGAGDDPAGGVPRVQLAVPREAAREDEDGEAHEAGAGGDEDEGNGGGRHPAEHDVQNPRGDQGAKEPLPHPLRIGACRVIRPLQTP